MIQDRVRDNYNAFPQADLQYPIICYHVRVPPPLIQSENMLFSLTTLVPQENVEHVHLLAAHMHHYLFTMMFPKTFPRGLQVTSLPIKS